MSLWILISLIALFWLSYPIFGGIGVAALVASGERSDDAGFSFLPEPIVFLGIAAAIDYIAMPWGRWLVSGLCVALFIWGVIASTASILAIRRMKNAR